MRLYQLGLQVKGTQVRLLWTKDRHTVAVAAGYSLTSVSPFYPQAEPPYF
jgi:hypothetical protein